MSSYGDQFRSSLPFEPFMKSVAQRIVWILGLFCLVFSVVGLLAFSPVTVAVSVTGWFLSRVAIANLGRQAEINAPTPDLQYWARTLLFRSMGLMALGAVIALGFIVSGISFHLSVHTQVLLTVLLVCAMVVITKLTLPGFFAASWEVHGVRERRKSERSSAGISRFIVRAVAVMILVSSLVGSFALMESIRLGAPRYEKLAMMARVVSNDAPMTIEGIFSPSETSTR
jgi:hypothetical protein